MRTGAEAMQLSEGLIETRGFLPLGYTPRPSFYSFILKKGLTKLQGPHYIAQAGRKLGSSCLSFPNALIISLHHHAWLLFSFHFETGSHYLFNLYNLFSFGTMSSFSLLLYICRTQFQHYHSSLISKTSSRFSYLFIYLF